MMHAVPVCTLEGEVGPGQEDKNLFKCLFLASCSRAVRHQADQNTAGGTEKPGWAAKRVKNKLQPPYGAEGIVIREWQCRRMSDKRKRRPCQLVNSHLSRGGSLHADVTHTTAMRAPLPMTSLLRASTCSSGKWKSVFYSFILKRINRETRSE